MTSRISPQQTPLPLGQELVVGDGAGHVANKRRKTTATPFGNVGSLDGLKDGRQDQDAAETLVSLLLRRNGTSTAGEERNNINKKRKRATARVSSCRLQSQDRVDTDSENEVTMTQPDTTPPLEEVQQREGSPQTVPGTAEAEEQGELAGTPRLPRAVRVTSRTHLVLHQLYLHKRFGSQCRDGGSPLAASSSSSTICANGAALPSMASRAAVQRTSHLQVPASTCSLAAPPCAAAGVTGSAVLRSPAAAESQTNVVAPIPQLLFTEAPPSSSLLLGGPRYVPMHGGMMIPSLTVPTPLVVESSRAPTDPRLVPIRPRPSPF